MPPETSHTKFITQARPRHTWRYACHPSRTDQLLECLATDADNEHHGLSWAGAECLAYQICTQRDDLQSKNGQNSQIDARTTRAQRAP